MLRTIGIAIFAGIAISSAALLTTAGAALVVGATVASLTLAHYAGKDS